MRTVKISTELHDRLKAISKDTGVKIQFMIDSAVEAWLKAHPKKRAA